MIKTRKRFPKFSIFHFQFSIEQSAKLKLEATFII